jgi:hypothetical protein
MKLTQAMMASIYRLKSRETGHLATRFFDLERMVGITCEPDNPCGVRACPRCLRRHLKHNLWIVLDHLSVSGDGRWKSIRLLAPAKVHGQELRQAFESVRHALRKLLRGRKPWPHPPSGWVVRFRCKYSPGKDGTGHFQLSVRLLVSVRGKLDLVLIRRRWCDLLRSEGLPTRAPAKRLTGIAELGPDRQRAAKRMVGTCLGLLGRIEKMKAEDAGEYLHLLRDLARVVVSR